MVDHRRSRSETCDVLVIGGGAAGVAAAVTAARQGLKAIVLERYGFCGGGAVAGLSGTVCGIYAASEDPIPGVTIEALAAAVNKGRTAPVLIAPLDDMAARVADVAKPGDLIITLGAGSISALAGNLVAELERRHGGTR